MSELEKQAKTTWAIYRAWETNRELSCHQLNGQELWVPLVEAQKLEAEFKDEMKDRDDWQKALEAQMEADKQKRVELEGRVQNAQKLLDELATAQSKNLIWLIWHDSKWNDWLKRLRVALSGSGEKTP